MFTRVLIFIFIFKIPVICTDGYKAFFGGGGDEYCSTLVVDSQGNYAVAGRTESWGTSGSSFDVLISKFSANGTMLWINSFGTTSDDFVNEMIILDDGNYAFCGSSVGEPTIVKVNSETGEVIWQGTQPYNTVFYYTLIESTEKDEIIALGFYNNDEYAIVVDVFDSGSNVSKGELIDTFDYYTLVSRLEKGYKLIEEDSSNAIFIGFSDYWSCGFRGCGERVVIFGKFDYETKSLSYVYAVGNENNREQPQAGLIASDGKLIIAGYTTDDLCLFIYRITKPPSSVSSGGVKICHDNFPLYTYDVMELLDGSFLIVGKVTILSKDYGLVVKVSPSCDDYVFIRYFLGTESFSSVLSQSFPYPEGRVLIAGRDDSKDCVIIRLESDSNGNILCDDSSVVEITTLMTANPLSTSITDRSSTFNKKIYTVNPNEDVGLSEVANPVLGRTMVCWSCYGILKDNSSHVCSNHGDCLFPDVCSCNSNYFGDDCSVFYCDEILSTNSEEVCSGHGNCVDHNDCQCFKNYTYEESDCSIFKCFGVFSNDTKNVCTGGNGNCTSHDFCECEGDWEGDMCNDFQCNGVSKTLNPDQVCSGHGVCSSLNNCTCDEHYYPGGIIGGDCDEFDCYGIPKDDPKVCNFGNGTCVSHNNCTCLSGWLGDSCERWKCFGIWKNETSTVCSNHGSCVFEDTCVCNPSPDYYGSECQNHSCFGIKMNESSVCSKHGKCVELNVCDCEMNYTLSSDCSVFECFGVLNNASNYRVCSGKGNCTFHDHCDCELNYTSFDCSVWVCNKTRMDNAEFVCSGKGNCTKPENCECGDGFDGDYCEDFYCHGVHEQSKLVCGSHGTCVSPNNCVCDEHYNMTVDCSIWTCHDILMNDTNAPVCSGYGNCTGYDYCDCLQNYTDKDCSKWYCDGYEKSEIGEVCSGHGRCVSPEKCDCDYKEEKYYIGQYCDYHECYGIGHNRTERCEEPGILCTCSGHGQCISHNNCSCHQDYPGIDCGSWTCFGIRANDYDHSCGINETDISYGLCVDVDSCFCYPGYSSIRINGPCTEWYCGSDHKDELKKVCSGMGSCVESQKCECRDGYEGISCETWSCGADYKLKSVTCSGHGKCTSPNECRCKNGFSGELCENNDLYGFVMAPVLSVFGFGTVIVIGTLICCVFCAISFCVLAVIVGCFFAFCLSGVVYIQKTRMKKFGKLKNIDILIREQELEADNSMARISINKGLFEIPYPSIHLTAVLGEGGSSSIVYKAIWRKQVVAFKSFKTRHVCSNQDSFDEFESEVTVLSSVSHPNIIRFFGGTLQPPRVGIVMEFCDNGDLQQFLKLYEIENNQDDSVPENHDPSKFYPLEEKVRMIHEIASAMDYLHVRKILHRDLKLENVLVDINENCKLMDFGLSKIVEKFSRVQQTKAIGTCIYMSPEIVKSGYYGPKTDVFSFGIMMFILITQNFSPYGKGDNLSMLEVRVSNDPNLRPDITELGKVLKSEGDQWMKDLMVNCWSHLPENRKTFSEILDVIEEFTIVQDALSQLESSDNMEEHGENEERKDSTGRSDSNGTKRSNSRGTVRMNSRGTIRVSSRKNLSSKRRRNTAAAVSSSSSSSSIQNMVKEDKGNVGDDDDDLKKREEDNNIKLEKEKVEVLKREQEMETIKKKNKALARQLFQIQREKDLLQKRNKVLENLLRDHEIRISPSASSVAIGRRSPPPVPISRPPRKKAPPPPIRGKKRKGRINIEM